jgi:hypothetical protein
VQKVLQRLGCCDGVGYRQLYTSWLLQRAVSEPERAAQYVLHTKTERMQFWAEVRAVGAGGWGGGVEEDWSSEGLRGVVRVQFERVAQYGLHTRLSACSSWQR